MSNKITIELCAEDRERVDNLAEKLDKWFTQEVKTAEPVEALPEIIPDPVVDDPADDLPFNTETPTAETQEAPKYKLADIQQKVVQLSAGGKKAEVREIVKSYAEKVSSIPEDKFSEVMEKLIGLEE